MCAYFRRVSICLMATACLVYADTWPAQERETRTALTMLACEYRSGLATISAGGEIASVTVDGITLPGYKNLNGLHALVHKMPYCKGLFDKGSVLWSKTRDL